MSVKHPTVSAVLGSVFLALEVLIACWTITALFTIAHQALRHGKPTGGEFWFGDMGLKVAPDSYRLSSSTLDSSAISIGEVFGSIGFELPATSGLMPSVSGPLCGILLCRALVLLALCDLFRRMFRSVKRREVFSERNIRQVYRVGFLIILLSVAGPLFERAYAGRMIDFVTHNVSTSGSLSIDWRLPPSQGMSAGVFWLPGHVMLRIDEDAIWVGRDGNVFRIDMRGLVIGLVLLGLGTALAQGLALQEENELTV